VEADLQLAVMRRFAFAQIDCRLTSEPNLVAALWEEIGAPVNPSHPDLTVLYCSLRCSGQTFRVLEFVAGETLEECVNVPIRRPASERSLSAVFWMPLKARRNGSGQAAAQRIST